MAAKSFKPTKKQPVKDGGPEDETNKGTRWLPDETDDVELSSNSIIDGAQYSKKNESKRKTCFCCFKIN